MRVKFYPGPILVYASKALIFWDTVIETGNEFEVMLQNFVR